MHRRRGPRYSSTESQSTPRPAVTSTRICYRLVKSDNPLAALPGYKEDIDPHSLETVRGAPVKVGFWVLAKCTYAYALGESKECTDRALGDNAIEAYLANPDIPAVMSARLVWKECVRLQGLRKIAYFALDQGGGGTGIPNRG